MCNGKLIIDSTTLHSITDEIMIHSNDIPEYYEESGDEYDEDFVFNISNDDEPLFEEKDYDDFYLDEF